MLKNKNSTEMQQFLRGFNSIMLTLICASLIWFAKTMLETKENVSLIKQDLGYIKRDVQNLQDNLKVQYSREQIDLKLAHINEQISLVQAEVLKIKNRNGL